MNAKHFVDEGKAWVFIADRLLTSTEVHFVDQEINSFLAQWQSHGTPMQAQGFCFQHGVIAIAADESQAKASGCSQDKITHLVKRLGEALNIDFFNRFNVLKKSESGTWELTKFNPKELHGALHCNVVSSAEFNQITA